MRPFPLAACAAAALAALAALAPTHAGAQPAPPAIAIRNVTVVDVEAGVHRPGQTVVVTGTRIAAVAPDAAVPAGATVVEGRGRYLIPGLWDMHAHLGEGDANERFVLPLFVAHGVTGVRDMWADWLPDSVMPSGMTILQEEIRVRDAVAAGRLLGPRVLLAGAPIDGPPGLEAGVSMAGDAPAARAAVDAAAAKHVDLLGPFPLLGREAFLAAAERARERGIGFAGMQPLQLDFAETAAAGLRSRDALQLWRYVCTRGADTVVRDLRAALAADARDTSLAIGDAYTGGAGRSRYAQLAYTTSMLYRDFDEARCAAAARRVAATESWEVPRMVSLRARQVGPPVFAPLAPRLAYTWPAVLPHWRGMLTALDSLPPDSARAVKARGQELWAGTLRLVGTLHRAGVRFMTGTETWDPFVLPGYGVHDEMRLLADAGLSPLDALRAATLEPARHLRATDSLGTVAAGKLADLVLLDADPLADIANTTRIHAVIVNGRLLDRAALDAMLDALRDAVAAAVDSTPPPAADSASASPEDVSARIDRLLAATPLVDGHSDLLRHWMECDDGCPRDVAAYDLAMRTTGDADLPRMRTGRLGVQLLNVFGPEYTAASTVTGFDLVHRLVARHPAELAIAATAADARRIHAAGRIAIVPTVEHAVRLESSVDVLRDFHRRGLRAVTLAYDTNDLADGTATAPRHGGLSALGRTMVAEMNRLGVLVDLSHVTDSTMHDVLDVSRAPVIFTHSSARALVDVPRNVPDDVLRRLPANGGVVMVSFVPYFTTREFADWYAEGERHWETLVERHGRGHEAVRRGMAVWDSLHPPPVSTIADVADHVDHVRRVAGIDHVGIGSDFDGIDFKVTGLEDAATFPALFAELARRGWTDDELRRLAGENFLRAWERAEAVASASATSTASAAELVIRDVTVVDVERGRHLPARTVLVRGNRIAEVRPSGGDAAPAGARVVDGTGRFLIPGLWDMHAHVLNRPDWNAPLEVANGVTGIRDMATSLPLAEARRIRADVQAGRIVGPRMVLAGPLIDGTPAIFTDYLSVPDVATARAVVDSLHGAGTDLIKVYTRLSREQFLAVVDQARRHGLQVAGHVPLALTTAEASDAGLWSVEHAYRHRLACADAEDEIRAALRRQVEAQARNDWRTFYAIEDSTFQLGLTNYSSERCTALGGRLGRNGTWFVPTLVEMRSRFHNEDHVSGGLDSLFAHPKLAYVPRAVVSYWRDEMAFQAGIRMAELFSEQELARSRAERTREVETRLRMVADLHRGGAGILAGTDASENFPLVVAGFSLHEELELLVRAGLSPLEALRTATLNPARALGATDSLGTVATGRVADLVLLDADPLADIRNTTRIHAVVFDGRLLDRAALDALLDGVRRAMAGAAATTSSSRDTSSPSTLNGAGHDSP